VPVNAPLVAVALMTFVLELPTDFAPNLSSIVESLIKEPILLETV
jgi:hypothetical protein